MDEDKSTRSKHQLTVHFYLPVNKGKDMKEREGHREKILVSAEVKEVFLKNHAIKAHFQKNVN